MGFTRSPNGSFHYDGFDGPAAAGSASAVGSPPTQHHHTAWASSSMARRLNLPAPGNSFVAEPPAEELYDGFTSCFDVATPAGVAAEEPDDLIDVDAVMAEAYPALQHHHHPGSAQQQHYQSQQQQQQQQQHLLMAKMEPVSPQPAAFLRRPAMGDFGAPSDGLTSPSAAGSRQASPMDTALEDFPMATPRGLERQERPLSMPVELEMPGSRDAFLLQLLDAANPPPPWPPLQSQSLTHQQRSLPSQHRLHHPYQHAPAAAHHLHHWQSPHHQLPSSLSASPASSATSSAAASPKTPRLAPGSSNSFPRMQRLHDVAAEMFFQSNERPADSAASSPSPVPSPAPSDCTSPAPTSPGVHGDRTHRCEHCGDMFANKWTLARHKRNIHGGKRYKCRFCDERFNASHTRNRHETNIHQDSLKVTCKDNWCRCKKKFQNETQLRNHLFQKRKARGNMTEEQLKSATF